MLSSPSPLVLSELELDPDESLLPDPVSADLDSVSLLSVVYTTGSFSLGFFKLYRAPLELSLSSSAALSVIYSSAALFFPVAFFYFRGTMSRLC